MNTILLLQWMLSMCITNPTYKYSSKVTICDSKSGIEDSKQVILPIEPFPDDLMTPIIIRWESPIPFPPVIVRDVTDVNP